MTGRRRGFDAGELVRKGPASLFTLACLADHFFEANLAMRQPFAPTLTACDMVFRAADAVNDLRPCATARSEGERVIDSARRSPPSVPTVKSGHREMRLRCVPCVVDLCHRQRGDGSFLLRASQSGKHRLRGLIANELRDVTRIRSASFSASLVSWAGLHPV